MAGTLSELFESTEAADELCAQHGLEAGAHVVQLAVQSVLDEGPTAFDPPSLPPTDDDGWRALVAERVRALMAERDDRVGAARRALKSMRRPRSTVKALARVVQRVLADQVIIDDPEAERLVEAARRIVLQGPRVPGGWSVPKVIDEPLEAALFLVCRHAITLAQSQVGSNGDRVPLELIAQLAPESSPSPDELIATLALGDQIGPLAVDESGRMIFARARAGGVLLLGPSGSGKTMFVVTLMATLPGAVILTFTKGQELRRWLTMRDNVAVLNATGETTGLEPMYDQMAFDPLTTVVTVADARRLAELTVTSQLGANSLVTDGKYWEMAAVDIVWPLVMWAAATGGSFAGVYAALVSEKFADALQWCRRSGNQPAAASIESYRAYDPRHRLSIQSTATVALRAYADELSGSLSSGPSIDWKDLIREGRTLAIYCKDSSAAHTRAYYVAALDAAIAAAAELAAEGWDGPKLNLILDEAANAVPHPHLPSLSTIMPGMGVNLITSFQDIAQLQRVWGAGGHELFNNAGTVLVLPGSTDLGLRQLIGSLEVVPGGTTADAETVTGPGISACLPVLPPRPGELILIDEHGRAQHARQLVAHREPTIVSYRVERSVLADIEFQQLVADQLPSPAR